MRGRSLFLPVMVALGGPTLSHTSVAQSWLFGTAVPKCSDPEVLAEVKEGISSGFKDRMAASSFLLGAMGLPTIDAEFELTKQRERAPYQEEIKARYCVTETIAHFTTTETSDEKREQLGIFMKMFAGVGFDEPLAGLFEYDILQNEDGSHTIQLLESEE